MTHSSPSRWKVSRQAGLLIIHRFYSFKSVFGTRSLSHNQRAHSPLVQSRDLIIALYRIQHINACAPFEVGKSRRNRFACYAYTWWNKRVNMWAPLTSISIRSFLTVAGIRIYLYALSYQCRSNATLQIRLMFFINPRGVSV